MKRFLLLLGFLACCLPVRADLIKQGAAYTRTVKMYATGSASGLAGATLTITASYNGAAPVSITPTVTPVGNGVYALSLTSAQVAALGALDMYITAAGADPTDTHDQIYSAIDANLTTIAGAGNAVTATGGVTFPAGIVSTYAGGAVASVTASVSLAPVDSLTLQTGTAVAVSAANQPPFVTLANAAPSATATYTGCVLRIIGGTGAGQSRYITAYSPVGFPKRAYLNAVFATPPDTSSVYVVQSAQTPAMNQNYIASSPVITDADGNVYVSQNVNTGVSTAGSVNFPATLTNFTAPTDYLTAGELAYLQKLDATISSRMATFAYTAPTTPPTVTAIRQEMDANSTKLAFLTGDAFARLGTPAGASIAADIATRSTFAGGAVASVTGAVGSVTGNVTLAVTPPTAAQIAAQVFSTAMQGGLTFLQYHNLQQALSHDAVRTYNATTHTATATWYALAAGGATDLTKAVYIKTTIYDSADKQIVSFTTSTPNVSYLN